MCAISREAMVASITYERFIRRMVQAHMEEGLGPIEAREAAHEDLRLLRKQDATSADLTREPEEKPVTTGE